MRTQQGQYRSQIKKHRRIRSQEPVYNSMHMNDKAALAVSGANPRIHPLDSAALAIEIIKPNSHQSVTVTLRKNVGMKQARDEICRKLQILGSQVYFYSLDHDLNFDYRFAEDIGFIETEKRLAYCYVDSSPNPQGRIEESDSIADYFIYDCLSVGGFSKVFLVRSKKSGKFYASKFVNKNYDSSQKFKDLIYNQRYINQILDYPLLVKMHKFIQTKQFYVFMLDYCPSGELFCLMKDHRDMTEDQAKFYFIETVLAIEHMHSRSIIYRDIKPENILLDKNGHVKIADFGLAKVMRDKSTSYCGSLEYMAPEIVLGNEHSFGVDHYCLGSLLFQIMVGCPPFYNPNFTASQTKYHIVNSNVKFPSDRTFSPDLIDFVTRLLDKNPKTRLGNLGGIKQILAHPWIGRFDRQKYENNQLQPPFKMKLDKSNFETTYLPKDQIQIIRRKIEKQINQQNKQKGSFKKKQAKLLAERTRLKSSQTPHKFSYNWTSTPKRRRESQNPYQVLIQKQGKSQKNLSLCSNKSIVKKQSKSLQITKNRSLTKKEKHYTSSNEIHEMMNKRQKTRQSILRAYINEQKNVQKNIKRSHNPTIHRKSGTFQKQNSLKAKFQIKSKESRNMLMQNLRSSLAEEETSKSQKDGGMSKGNGMAKRLSKALMSAIRR